MTSVSEDVIVVWLTDLPDVIRVRQRSAADAVDRSAQRVHPNLSARTKAVTDCLAGCGLPTDCFGPQDPVVYGLARIEPTFVHDDLRELCAAGKMQREFFSQLSHGASNVGNLFFFRVLDVIPLKHPLVVPALHGHNCFFAQLPSWFVADMLEEIRANTLQPPTWFSYIGGEEAEVCLRVARPFAMLAVTGSLPVVGVCDLGKSRPDLNGKFLWSVGWSRGRRLHGRSDGYHGVLHKLKLGFGAPRFAPPSEERIARSFLEPDTCEEFLVALRASVAAALPRYGVDEALRERFQDLHDWASALQVLSDRLRLPDGRTQAESFGHRYNIVTLVNAFWACGHLKADATLLEASCWILRTCLPPVVADSLVQRFQKEESPTILPSKSLISKLRGRVDVAWMLTFRAELARMISDHGVCIFPFVDSSPQGGRDYEIVVLNVIDKGVLPKLHCCVAFLESRSNQKARGVNHLSFEWPLVRRSPPWGHY